MKNKHPATAQSNTKDRTAILLHKHGPQGVIFLQNVESLLKTNGHTKRWLSLKLEKKESFISGLCRGTGSLTISLMSSISKALGVDLTDLLKKPGESDNAYAFEVLMPKLKFAEKSDIDRLCSYYDSLIAARREERTKYMKKK